MDQIIHSPLNHTYNLSSSNRELKNSRKCYPSHLSTKNEEQKFTGFPVRNKEKFGSPLVREG